MRDIKITFVVAYVQVTFDSNLVSGIYLTVYCVASIKYRVIRYFDDVVFLNINDMQAVIFVKAD